MTNIRRLDPIATARTLAELDANMRKDHPSPRVAVAARVRFYETAVRLYAVGRLDRLAQILPADVRPSLLSSGSLDCVFQDHRYSAAAVAHIVGLVDRDPAFKRAMADQEGETHAAYLRSLARVSTFGQAVAA